MSEITLRKTLIESERALANYSKLLHLRNLLEKYKKELEDLRKAEAKQEDEWLRGMCTDKCMNCETKKIAPTQKELDELPQNTEADGKEAYALLKEGLAALPETLRTALGTAPELLASEKKRIHAVNILELQH